MNFVSSNSNDVDKIYKYSNPKYLNLLYYILHREPVLSESKMSTAKYQAVAETSPQNQVNSSTTPFTKELLEHLYKLFQSSLFTNPSCSLAQAGNYLTVALSNVKMSSLSSWILSILEQQIIWQVLQVCFSPIVLV